ncbi:MAG TPA: A/G-specific adenine glycosylase [Cytophagaceae bacterium]|jgi:A/G-specific adenine glycosylase
MKFEKFSWGILEWYENNKRDLPWREYTDPYIIWLSEIILQQTRVDQGLSYFNKFIAKYPTVELLAEAEEQEVLRLWQGLGYYSRARNLHFSAKKINEDYEGVFPPSYQALLKLKGVGRYTAAAIASFAYKEPVAVVDGNVLRVLARVFGIKDDIASGRGMKEFERLAADLLPSLNSHIYNQGIMEFGALHCTPQLPKCVTCPFNSFCYAFQHSAQKTLPVKSKKLKKKERYFHYLVFKSNDSLLMQRRGSNDIWKGLFEFLLLEGNDSFTTPQTILAEKHIDFTDAACINLVLLSEKKHILTHQNIYAKFWLVEIHDEAMYGRALKIFDLQSFEIEEVHTLPKPVLINNFLINHIF